jgi:hypothetical protein
MTSSMSHAQQYTYFVRFGKPQYDVEGCLDRRYESFSKLTS